MVKFTGGLRAAFYFQMEFWANILARQSTLARPDSRGRLSLHNLLVDRDIGEVEIGAFCQ